MGKSLTQEQHVAVYEWALQLKYSEIITEGTISISEIREIFYTDLLQYFRLCALARSKSADQVLAQKAHMVLFKTRVIIEKAMIRFIENHPSSNFDKLDALFSGAFFGASKKQGVSLRMHLSSCTPTKLCAGGCYAHDVLDAAPNAMMRGVINGYVANAFEKGTHCFRKEILTRLQRHSFKAIRSARMELKNLPTGFKRRAYIRFSHVGEIAAFPNFANALAKQIRSLSKNSVDCIVYSRHPKAKLLDPDLWTINFTLDHSSMDRLNWAPPEARIVYSAFDGVTSSKAEINFLEHHRFQNIPRSAGNGRICPATKPETVKRSCDDCRCKRCFVKPH
jgi:hypothetical protein